MIKQYQEKGYAFYIYRPTDRNFFMSPDLFYVDFMAGPADKYFWKKDELITALTKGKKILLSDTKSWEKLHNKKAVILAQDDYSSLILMP